MSEDLLNNMSFMLLLAHELNNASRSIPPDGGFLRARDFALRLRKMGIEFSREDKTSNGSVAR